MRPHILQHQTPKPLSSSTGSATLVHSPTKQPITPRNDAPLQHLQPLLINLIFPLQQIIRLVTLRGLQEHPRRGCGIRVPGRYEVGDEDVGLDMSYYERGLVDVAEAGVTGGEGKRRRATRTRVSASAGGCDGVIYELQSCHE